MHIPLATLTNHPRYDAIKEIASHPLDPDTALVTLTVLVKGSREDISEWDIQEHRPTLLFDYWASFKGRTQQDVLGIGDLYHPYRLLQHRCVRGQWQVLVQWLGTRRKGNITASTTKQTTKRKRDSLTGHPKSVSDRRRRSSRHDSIPAIKSPIPKPSPFKKVQSQALADGLIPPQRTPKSTFATRRQSNLTVGSITSGVTSSAHAQPQSRQKSLRESSVANSSTTASRRLSPADVSRTMLRFMDSFTVGDMQKVCSFIDENCTGKLRFPLYSGGDWDGNAASGRWVDVFMLSPLGRLGQCDNEVETEE
ncbi:hypothetical protein CDEST_15355 [Colletotrichum destructivum]|uniref:Uncharacterized protein n=1 Tax=Colletotrichum destructivum TaxID=34406 RepID=A0AAX4J499_9PEZI|nr:hypothetical protein CDEST_15355 [Colletotrichum destructivum]